MEIGAMILSLGTLMLGWIAWIRDGSSRSNLADGTSPSQHTD